MNRNLSNRAMPISQRGESPAGKTASKKRADSGKILFYSSRFK